jgi:hypothetical protein
MHRISASLCAALGLAASACGSSGVPGCDFSDSAAILQSVTSTSGNLKIELWTSPQPPIRGVICGKYLIKDAQGKPQDSLTVGVLPYMPAMGHGLSVNPTVLNQGGGVYFLSQMYLPMPGEYELRTTLQDPASQQQPGGTTDNAVPSFNVP